MNLRLITAFASISSAFETIRDNARFFENDVQQVPTQALTVGIKTIMRSQEVLLMASGTHKAVAIQQCIEGGISNLYTASIIQHHPKGLIVCDEDATQELRVKTVTYYQDLQQVHRYPRARETTAFLDSIVFDRRQPGRSQNAESHLAVHG